jgi:hypothetical protein
LAWGYKRFVGQHSSRPEKLGGADILKQMITKKDRIAARENPPLRQGMMTDGENGIKNPGSDCDTMIPGSAVSR